MHEWNPFAVDFVREKKAHFRNIHRYSSTYSFHIWFYFSFSHFWIFNNASWGWVCYRRLRSSNFRIMSSSLITSLMKNIFPESLPSRNITKGDWKRGKLPHLQTLTKNLMSVPNNTITTISNGKRENALAKRLSIVRKVIRDWENYKPFGHVIVDLLFKTFFIRVHGVLEKRLLSCGRNEHTFTEEKM